MGGIYEWPDLDAMLDNLIPALEALGLNALDISCANSNYFETAGPIVRKIRARWSGILIGGASLTVDQAEAELSDDMLDAVTWGRAFIANPDLVQKIKSGAPWTAFEDAMRDTLV